MCIDIFGMVFDVSSFPLAPEVFAAAVPLPPGTTAELLLDGIPPAGFNTAVEGADAFRAASTALGETIPTFCGAALRIEADTPMARAFDDWASKADFSRICFCFSSSLATMARRSSGMGLLSCRKGVQIDLL